MKAISLFLLRSVFKILYFMYFHIASISSLISVHYFWPIFISILIFIEEERFYSICSVFAIYGILLLNKLYFLRYKQSKMILNGILNKSERITYRELDIVKFLISNNINVYDAHVGNTCKEGFKAMKPFFKTILQYGDRNTFQTHWPAWPIKRAKIFYPKGEDGLDSSVCYFGYLSSFIIFLRSNDFENISSYIKYEILHELGHTMHKGNYFFNLLITRTFTFIMTFLASIVFIVNLEDVPLAAIVGYILSFLLLFQFLKRRRAFDEVRADDFATANLSDDDRIKVKKNLKSYTLLPKDRNLSDEENKFRRKKLLEFLDLDRRNKMGENVNKIYYDGHLTGIPSRLTELISMSFFYGLYCIISAISLFYLIKNFEILHINRLIWVFSILTISCLYYFFSWKNLESIIGKRIPNFSLT